MKKFVLAMAGCCLWTFGAAAAEDNSFYVGIHGGALAVEDSDVTNSAGTATVDLDTGFAIGGVFGYKMAPGVRFEAEYTYRRAGIDDACTGSACLSSIADADGHVDAHALMANMWYEPRFGKWLPYAGGGLGVGIVGYDATLSALGSSLPDDGDDAVFAYQAGGGIGYEFSPGYVASLDYRYWATTDPEFDGADAEIGTHSFLVGLRRSF